MHISEGMLSVQVLAGGGALALAGLGVGLRKIEPDRLMSVAILSAAFFVASLVHVPVGPSSVHLVLSGLIGMMLGWAAFPAIFVALLLQAIFFQYGGLSVLGVNTFNMAMPAVVFGLLFRPLLARGRLCASVASFCCGSLSVAGAALCTCLSLALSGEEFFALAGVFFVSHLPLMLVEGAICMLTAGFLLRVSPEIFGIDTSSRSAKQ